jgi:hypothetical protein
MRIDRVRRSVVSALLLALLGLSLGCGSDLVKVRGQIVRNGEPFQLPAGDRLRVTLVPVVEGKTRPDDSYSSNTSDPEKGTFEILGKDNRGIPKGKYRIAVEWLHRREDQFKGKYGAERSPIIREVTASESMTVDLEKPQG